MSPNLTMKHHTVAQVAELMTVNHNTVRALIKRGDLPAVKFGGAIRIAEADLVEYLERQQIRQPARDDRTPHGLRRRRMAVGKDHFA